MSLRAKFLDRGEDPASDDLAFDAAEPEFDLIEPRGIGRSKMQVQLGMFGQELCDPLGLMGRPQSSRSRLMGSDGDREKRKDIYSSPEVELFVCIAFDLSDGKGAVFHSL